MTIDRRKQIAFEEAADLFDEVRPGYPETLVADVLALSAISPDGRILEIGISNFSGLFLFAEI
jgi:hypothetical protein